MRRPALLRQVFGVCLASPAQVVSLQKIQGQLQDAGALETIAHYLRLLEEAYLVAAVGKHSTRDARRRASPPKLVVLSNAFLAAAEPAALPPDRERAWLAQAVQNACLAHAWNAGQSVSYWREEPLDVDGILQGSWGSWAIEVKLGQIQPADLRGVLEFCRRHPSFQPLVLGDEDALDAIAALAVPAQPWREFLRSGPPGFAPPQAARSRGKRPSRRR